MAANQERKPKEKKNDWTSKFYEKKVDLKLLNVQFSKLKMAKPAMGVVKRNLDKCRYKNVGCIDETRVVLMDRPPDNFIHGNFMMMPDGSRFIACQGPMLNTIDDHLLMAISQNVGVMIMLCDFEEDEIQKCIPYLPIDEETRKFDQYGVKRVSEIQTIIDGVVQMRLEIFEIKTGEVKCSCSHYQMISWPDHGAPETVASSLKLLELVKREAKGSTVLVHCSAGIGRTGTFIGTEYGRQRLEMDPDIQPIEIVQELRMMRLKAVQDSSQFLYMILSWTAMAIKEGAERNENMNGFAKQFRRKMREREEKKKRKEEEKKKKKTIETN